MKFVPLDELDKQEQQKPRKMTEQEARMHLRELEQRSPFNPDEYDAAVTSADRGQPRNIIGNDVMQPLPPIGQQRYLQDDRKFTPLEQLDQPQKYSAEYYKQAFSAAPRWDERIIRGGLDIGQGVKQAYLEATNLPASRDYTQQVQSEIDDFERRAGGDGGILRSIGRISATSPTMLVPGGNGAMLARIGSSAVGGALAGGAEFVPEGGSRANNAIKGAAIAGATQGALSGLGKGINVARGALSSAAPVMQRIEPGLGTIAKPSISQAASKAAREIPLTAGESSGSRALKGIESVLDDVPLGTGAFREKQAAATKAGIEGVLDAANPANIEDAGEAVQKSLQRTLNTRRGEAKALYDKVGSLANGAPPITPSAVKNKAAELLEKYPDIFDRLPSEPIKKKLQAIIGVDKPISFEDMRFLREQVGGYVSRAEKAASAVADKEVMHLRAIRGAIDDDIAQWAESSGNQQLSAAFKQANKHYRENISPFKSGELGKAARYDTDADRVFQMFVKPDRPALANKALGALDSDGVSAMKYGVLKNAYDSATNVEGMFNPSKFVGEIDRLGKVGNVVFSAEEKAALDGLHKIMLSAKKGSEYQGGRSAIADATDAALSKGGGVLRATAGLLVAPAAVPLTKLLTTESGKRLLLSASRLQVGDPRMQELVNAAYKAVPIGALESGRE